MSISGDEATVIAGIVGGGSAVIAAGLAAWATYKVTDRTVREAKAEGELQRSAVEKERQLDRQHEWDLAAEERRQERRRDTYLTLEIYITGWADFASWRIRMYETEPPTPAPDILRLEPQTMAIANLMASDSVVEAALDFTKKVMSFRVAIGSLEQAQAVVSSELPGSYVQAAEFDSLMRTRGADVVAAQDAVRLMMREELAGAKRLSP
jgi:hypothetical protein